MCGIWAIIDPVNPITEYQRFCDISEKVSRRGPDKAGVLTHPHAMLAFYRLAFHDLSPLGDQPSVFFEPDGSCVFLLCNGEIYNYRDLVDHHGFSLKSGNDCEVIYHLFRKFGWDRPQEVLSELDGEYVFVIIRVAGDKITRAITARDPFGVRPLFMTHPDKNRWVFSSLAQGIESHAAPFPPGHYFSLHGQDMVLEQWYHFPETILHISDSPRLCRLLIEALFKRTSGERPIACLLSGGLDSSLLCAIMVHILGWKDLPTFSIGMEGSTDLKHAQEVAEYLGTNHTNIIFTPEEGFAVIDEVIEACETWDITTIRASVGQFLLARYISENTECRAVINGDGADEVEMGYLYWNNAPSRLEAHLESLRRLREIHLYDGLRVDRCLGWFGLEARLPYLDRDFVDFLLQMPIDKRIPTTDRMEKSLLREAIAQHYPGILPNRVLWRKKEAFSDGVSSQKKSWFEMIRDYMESRVSDEEFDRIVLGFSERPPTKEAYYYQKVFLEKFGSEKKDIIPGYWLPKWSGGIREPSARVLPVYTGPEGQSQ